MGKDTTTLIVPNDLCFLPLIAAYIQAAATQSGFGEEEVADVRMAVDEACTYILLTAFEPGETQEITISCQRSSTGLQVTIADQGIPFDSRAIPRFEPGYGPNRDLRGLPFYLIQQAVDEVRFVNRGLKGKELQLTKYRKTPGVETFFTPEELSPRPAPGSSPFGELEYRLMRPDEAAGVSRCIYQTYRYAYPAEHLYFPERLAAMNESGEMISVVAVTGTGEIVGHCALAGRPGSRVREIAQGFVAPSYRGLGTFNKITERVVAEGKRWRLGGIFGDSVTTHPYSQRSLALIGFRGAALLLAYAPMVRVKGIMDNSLSKRQSMLYMYLPLWEEPCAIVFAPAHHQSMIDQIYANLGLKRQFAAAEAGGSQPRGNPSFSVAGEAVAAPGTVVIEIAEYGPGIEQEVKGKLRDLCHEGAAVIYLHLPLGDPRTAPLCQRFEEFGFFFSGVLIQPVDPSMPAGAPTADLLCLQYLNGAHTGYDQIQMDSDFDRELAAYVRSQDPLS